MNLVKLRKLSYEDVAKCNRCGFCLPACPIYSIKGVEAASPRGRNAITRAVIEGRLDWSEDIEKSIFSCLGCGACTVACFPSIGTKEIVFRDRACLVDVGIFPRVMDRLGQSLKETHNIAEEDNDDRIEWTDLFKDLPDHRFERERAEVVYFVGCVSSFFPMAQSIPASMAAILTRADVDFAVLGGEEWCCGYPLIGAGMPDEMEALINHNMERVREMGAKKAVFTCPSCYHTWKTFYPAELEILSASEFLEGLVQDGALRFKKTPVTVTYHDPCDLGRNSGIYEPPREVLKAIPGIRLKELPNNRELAVCCGGGGNLEMVDPELSGEIAQMKIDEILKTEADMVVSSCQQCLRTIAGRARRKKIDLVVKDITEVVAEALA